MTDYRTDLSRVRGLGAAKYGTEHFWMQRVTSFFVLILFPFLFYSVIYLAGKPLAEVKEYFASPIIATLAVLLIALLAHHMRLGMQVMIEDYVHTSSRKLTLLMLNVFFSTFVGVAGVIAIIKLSLGA
jgi:succinate dehydrogenase / fumarate reductase membrane anchor subunit